MSGLIGMAVLLGVDNLRAGLGFGPVALSSSRRIKLAVSFGAFEAGMPVLGWWLGDAFLSPVMPFANVVGAVALGGCGLFILLGSAASLTWLAARSWLVFLLPLSLSFDNLLAGVGFSSAGLLSLGTIAFVGLVSSSLSWIGLWGGEHIARFLPVRRQFIAGAATLVLSLVVLFD